VGGLIGLSRLLGGDERIQHLKYAIDYYELHAVDQPPLDATARAEEIIALNEVGRGLTKVQKETARQLLRDRKRDLQAFYLSKLGEVVRV